MALINCKECGQEISDAAAVCPHCGAPVIKDVYCRKCGTKVPENTKFCPTCGEPIAAAAPAATEKKKDRLVAGLLAIFLGGIGIDYFYLGKTTAGVICIVISLFSCYLWGILMLIKGIYMITLTDEVFYEKYVDNDRTLPIF